MRRRIGLLGLLCLLPLAAVHARAQEGHPEGAIEQLPSPTVDGGPFVPVPAVVEAPSVHCRFPGINFGMPPPAAYGVAPGPISDYQPTTLPPGPGYSVGMYYNPLGASPPLTGYGPRPGLAYVPDTKIDCKTGRTVVVDTSARARMKSLFNRVGCMCWATHNNVGCGSLYAEYLFIFGSCRQFWGDPCLPGPPPLPLPPGVDPIPQPPCCGKW